MSTPFRSLTALGMLAALSACGPDTMRTIGLTRDAPDEFQVTTRAPLSMPPDMTALPTPRPGASRPQERSARDQAEAALVPSLALENPRSRAAGRSAGEAALVASAGGPASGDVRQRVDEESLRLERPERSLTDRLMFWRAAPPAGVPVDPNREARRLRENAALGRETTDGQTPVIQPQRRGGFFGLFGG